jgi:hypothetical protein
MPRVDLIFSYLLLGFGSLLDWQWGTVAEGIITAVSICTVYSQDGRLKKRRLLCKIIFFFLNCVVSNKTTEYVQSVLNNNMMWYIKLYNYIHSLIFVLFKPRINFFVGPSLWNFLSNYYLISPLDTKWYYFTTFVCNLAVQTKTQSC